MKAIDRGTVRDLGGLFVNGGFMITANPCVDEGAEELCEDIVQLAGTIPHDGVVVVERMQKRGKAPIDRPHVHWIMMKSKAEVEQIAGQLREKGLDVKITPVWGVDGLCYYLGKDPNAICYLSKEEYHTGGAGTPPAAHKERGASVPEPARKKDQPIKVMPMATTRQLAHTVVPTWDWTATEHLTMILRRTAIPLARPYRIGMCRAP